MADEEPPPEEAAPQEEAAPHEEAASQEPAAPQEESAPHEETAAETVEAAPAEDAPPADGETKDQPDLQASTASVKDQGSVAHVMRSSFGSQGSAGGLHTSPSKAIITSSTAAVNALQLKVSPSGPSPVPSASATPSKLALASARGSQVHSSKMGVSPSKSVAIQASRLELLAHSKISLSRTGLSPSVMVSGSKAVVSSQMAFSPSRANVGSRVGLDRTASKADRQRSLDQRVNLARQNLSGSTMSIRHIDYEAEKNKGPRYMNTYRMDSKYPFNPDKVEKVIKEVFDMTLAEMVYEPKQAARLALTMSAEIRNRVKAFQFERYKIVVIVDIGEKLVQSLFSGFRYLWDAERDFYAMYKFENVTLFAVGCCYGVYHE